MMIHAYSEFYLSDAKTKLSRFFDYAVPCFATLMQISFLNYLSSRDMLINLNVVILLLFLVCLA